jgi:glycylpeptide N-tetradecanoyltransferase
MRSYDTAVRIFRINCSSVPAKLRVRDNVMDVAEWNFLCVHRDWRNKGLTPALFKEMARRCSQNSVQQAVFTGGELLPTPASSCPYCHRPLNWEKLYDVDFIGMPIGSTPAQEIERYSLPEMTATKGLREMEVRDVDAVTSLLQRQLAQFALTPQSELAIGQLGRPVAHPILAEESQRAARPIRVGWWAHQK